MPPLQFVSLHCLHFVVTALFRWLSRVAKLMSSVSFNKPSVMCWKSGKMVGVLQCTIIEV